MNGIEILAPVGGREQLIAAVRSGADAVYLGAKGFNARRNAENFVDLSEAVNYCHARGVKVHVTVNTLVTDGELPALKAEIKSIAEAGADAVIVQDLAVAKLFRECCPDMPLHASTQMTIHDVYGAETAKRLGFRRIVPARELSLGEIRALSETGLEIECFVHGALCMCVSGGCYLSAMLGGRSGNRGLCAQPCRLDFTAPDGRAYALSLKDMSYVSHIAELKEAGVCSFKIEGRMKRPEYVAAAVTACRAALRGEKPDMAALEAVFSRSGFTDGYLTGCRTRDMFGYRRQEDVQASAKVLSSLAELYRAEGCYTAVDMTLSLRAGQSAGLLVTDGENAAACEGAQPQRALTKPTDLETARRALSRTGGTPFYLEKLALESDEGLMLPPSELNALRREALEKLLKMREKGAARPWTDRELKLPERHAAPEKPRYRLRFESFSQFFDDAECDVILPVNELLRHPELIERLGGRLIGELPMLHFTKDAAALDETLAQLYKLGLRAVLGGNIGDIAIAERHGFELHGGHALNILNSLAIEEYARLGLKDATVSFEANMRDIAKLGGELARGLIAYGYLPLMNMRACPAQSKNGCGSCGGRPVLKDRRGVSFQLMCRQRRYTALLNSVPLDIADKSIAKVDFLTLYFTTETRGQCEEILRRFRAGESAGGERTGGLYYRELK